MTLNVDPASEAYEEQPNIDQTTLNTLVFEYLVHNCFPQAAHALNKDAQTPIKDHEGDEFMTDTSEFDSHSLPPKLLQTLDARHKIYSAVVSGDLMRAIQYANDAYPQLLNSKELRFELEIQHFIELLRKKDTDSAMSFAQNELGKYIADFMDRIQEIVPLIAYPNPETSPMAKEMDVSRRERVASLLNQTLLRSLGLEPESPLEKLVKQAMVTREFINVEATKDKKSKIVYPLWNLGLLLGKSE